MNNGTFSGKVALVTGGTSGIGKATAIEFARAGAKVVLTGRRDKEGAQVVAEIKKVGGDGAFAIRCVTKFLPCSRTEAAPSSTIPAWPGTLVWAKSVFTLLPSTLSKA